MIYVYIIANIFFLHSIIKQHISFTNIFIFIYWGFMLLYPLSIYSIYALDISEYVSGELHYLLGNESIVNAVLQSASIALCTFSVLMILKPIKRENIKTLPFYNIKKYKILFLLLFPIVLYLNSITNWTTDRAGLLPSMAAYSRNIMTVLAVLLILPQNISVKNKLFYLFLFMIITFTSTQRTNALIVIIALVYTLRSSKTALRVACLGLLALIVLGSIRNNQGATNLLFPILGEGLFGSWGLLQAVEISSETSYSWSQLFMLFNEFFNWIFQTIHLPISLPTLGELVSNRGITYYPMGGFFYLSDAYLMHPILGPIFYTFLIYFIYRKCANKYYLYHTPLSLICLSLLFDAVKGSICVFMVMLIFHILSYYVTLLIVRKKKLKKQVYSNIVCQ